MANETRPVENNTATETGMPDSAPAEVATPRVDTATPVRPTRKPREKVRPIDELVHPSTSVKSMTDKEKTLLIEHYKQETNRLTQQVEAYRHNAEEAYKKAQLFENAANDIAAQGSAKFNDIIQAVSMLYKTVYLIAKDGTKND